MFFVLLTLKLFASVYAKIMQQLFINSGFNSDILAKFRLFAQLWSILPFTAIEFKIKLATKHLDLFWNIFVTFQLGF